MNIVIENKHLLIEIDKNAVVTKLVNKLENKSVLKESKPISTLVLNDRSELAACSASYKDGVLTVGFANSFSADIKVEVLDDYFTFSLDSVSTDDFWSFTFIDLRTDVAGSRFMTCGMGLTLNVKMGEYPGKNEELSATVYTHIGYENAQFAVIGVNETQMNAVQRKIVDAIPFGQMPKGAYSGPYATDCKDANRTYAIRASALTLENVDEYIEVLCAFGVTQVNLHQAHMFRTGDFEVYNKELYPNGLDDFKAVINKLHKNDINVFLHSYSFFVDSYGNPNAAGGKYLRPIPHKDLAVHRNFTLAKPLGIDDTEIYVNESLEDFDTKFGFYINASPVICIDNELMYIKSTDKKTIAVQRGAYQSETAEHKCGAEVKQYKSYFTHLMPEKDSELFFEIARNTAEFYNECDFDGFYIDSIDGVGQLDGDEFAWYYGVLFVNEVFKHLKKPPIFNCCYGSQYPGHWFARTVMGAFDAPYRGYRDYIDAHVDFNAKYAEKMGLISELGWWALFPDVGTVGWKNKPMWCEDIEYLMSKTVATDSTMCWLKPFEYYKEIPHIANCCPTIQKYINLQKSGLLTDEIKQELRRPETEYVLFEKEGKYSFKQNYTDRQRIESFEEGRNKLVYNNRFESQSPKIRIEGLWSAKEYDCDEAKPLLKLDENEKIEFGKLYDVSNPDNQSQKGLGVWVHGDGKGEVINIRLHCEKHIETGVADHFIKVDFTGWRYYSFYEFQNAEMKHSEYPMQTLDYKVFEDVIDFNAVYRYDVAMDHLEKVEMLVHPQGDYDIKMKDIVILPEVQLEYKNPTITANGKSITFETVLKSGEYIEYDPETNTCVQGDKVGNVIATPKVLGEIVLQSGDNTVSLTAECDSNLQKRAALTLITFGDKI